MDLCKCIQHLSVLFTILLHCLAECRVLDDYIRHYDVLTYDTQAVHDNHMRHKRSIDPHVQLEFRAFDKPLKLRLISDSGAVFPPDFVLDFNGTVGKPDLSFLYTGEVLGETGSQVHGSIIEGVFQGTIRVPSDLETYHVEKSHRFFENRPVFHSVIYKESDMNLDPFRERRTRERREAQELGTCGYANAMEWMKQTLASEVITPNRAKRHDHQWQEVHSSEASSSKYSARANENTGDRAKRAVEYGSLKQVNNLKNSCFMYLMSDKTLWDRHITKAGGNEEVAKDEILAFFFSHVKAIKDIYSVTKFQTYSGDMFYTDVSFAAQRTKIMTNADCNDATFSRFCNENIDVSNFLNMNSLLNHDQFCLAYVFTYRDFSGGTLGLAWVGSPGGASGGLCEKNKVFSEGGQSVRKSLNTGIVTTINYGKEVASKVSQLTFAHEVGHNFGSPHDSGDGCAPFGTSAADANQGNYIMFASATMGDKLHNSQFSTCSRDNITRVMRAVLTSASKTNCFEKEEGAFCGNNIVEENEKCDCGFYGDCNDICCYAMNDQSVTKDKWCTLKGAALCSPSEGPCCNKSTCTYAGENGVCRSKQDCASEAKCNGLGAACPPSTKEPNGSFCNDYGFTCINGECAGSLCAHFEWEECFTTGQTKTKEEQERLCRLGCKQPSQAGTNVSSQCITSDNPDIKETGPYFKYYNMLKNITIGKKGNIADIAKGVQLAPGSPCNNFQGYCDVFHRCRGVDAEGPLARLKNLIFNPETLKDIGNWIVEKWWAVLLMAIGLVLLMGLFIKFCAVHTPSSNPKAKPARKLSETMTLRRKQRNPNAARQPQTAPYPEGARGGGRADLTSSESERLSLMTPGQTQASYQNPQGPPPPYPGSSTSASSRQGPPHGHGKKGKARKSHPHNMEII
ncbi:disintegrin and metalloproteinase domain-containing protein 10-like isoform X5 [Dreissena polymorpha]|uniref:disintegrin and metalloproteinase domain-containing protein 10-like isoform X5 n=1 Tax=Dreissena polymorpha TaxID=45954 RepID=UPI0022649106|nr:disintegrin and metalloproteinase domain-containing protein 10-like isoform X5 [Dreissena polymorpha]